MQAWRFSSRSFRRPAVLEGSCVENGLCPALPSAANSSSPS